MEPLISTIQDIDRQIKELKLHRATLERDMQRILEDRFASRGEVREFVISEIDEDNILYDEGYRGYFVSPFSFDTSGIEKMTVDKLGLFLKFNSLRQDAVLTLKPGVVVCKGVDGFTIASEKKVLRIGDHCLERLHKHLTAIIK